MSAVDIVVNDHTVPLIQLDNPKYLPRPLDMIEYTFPFETCCALYLAKFHSLPPVVYQYQYRYFFPVEKEDK